MQVLEHNSVFNSLTAVRVSLSASASRAVFVYVVPSALSAPLSLPVCVSAAVHQPQGSQGGCGSGPRLLAESHSQAHGQALAKQWPRAPNLGPSAFGAVGQTIRFIAQELTGTVPESSLAPPEPAAPAAPAALRLAEVPAASSAGSSRFTSLRVPKAGAARAPGC